MPFAARAQSQSTDLEIREIAQQLTCPLCSGKSLDTCELKVCDQMKTTISQKLSQGYSPEAVKAEFVKMYGPSVILGEKPNVIESLPTVAEESLQPTVAEKASLQLRRIEWLLFAITVLLVGIILTLVFRRRSEL